MFLLLLLLKRALEKRKEKKAARKTLKDMPGNNKQTYKQTNKLIFIIYLHLNSQNILWKTSWHLFKHWFRCASQASSRCSASQRQSSKSLNHVKYINVTNIFNYFSCFIAGCGRDDTSSSRTRQKGRFANIVGFRHWFRCALTLFSSVFFQFFHFFFNLMVDDGREESDIEESESSEDDDDGWQAYDIFQALRGHYYCCFLVLNF